MDGQDGAALFMLMLMVILFVGLVIVPAIHKAWKKRHSSAKSSISSYLIIE